MPSPEHYHDGRSYEAWRSAADESQAWADSRRDEVDAHDFERRVMWRVFLPAFALLATLFILGIPR